MITTLIFTHNDEEHIEEAVESAKLLGDTVTVIDISSTDSTREKAEASGATVHKVPFSSYVEPVRAQGIETVKTEWFFILDGDERITPHLADEIKHALSSPSATHYKIPRKEFFARKLWLKHGGWWPNHQIRLIKTAAYKNWPTAIHSTPEIEGALGYLHYPLFHYSKNNYEKIVEKTIVFEDIESELLYKANKTAGTLTFFRKFLGELWRRLIVKGGWRDGTIGIIESVYQAFSKTITYLYLYEKKKGRAL